jgi:uncharacterized membrane protein YkoI
VQPLPVHASFPEETGRDEREAEEDTMHRFRTRTKLAVAAAVVLAVGAIGGGVAVAAGGDDDATDTPITGTALERASAAALAHTGGGKVTGTEVGDEESRYEVEVTRDDGSQVDVQLDERFRVVGSEDEQGERDD